MSPIQQASNNKTTKGLTDDFIYKLSKTRVTYLSVQMSKRNKNKSFINYERHKEYTEAYKHL